MERPDFILLFKPLLEDKNVSKLEAIIYGYIYWLTRLKNEKCTAGNNVLAELADTSPQTVVNALTNLERNGYIRRYYSGSKFGDRAEIIPLLTMSPKPVDVGDLNPGVLVPKPGGVQNKSIEEEHTQGESKDSQGTRTIPEREFKEERPRKQSNAKYPHSKQIFSLFPRPDASWAMDRTQLKHAEMLFERGEAKVKNALRFSEEHRGEHYFPQVTSPYELNTKWQKLLAAKNKL